MSNKKIVIVYVILILIAGTLFFTYYNRFIKTNKNIENSKDIIENTNEQEIKKQNVEIKPIKVYTGFDRPIAVMIDNEKAAWPHSGLQDAYMIYEIIIEGGETRMMALFKNQTTEKIGPIRSARHYFVHYAMEHNAIYAHFGWSPKAQETIKSYNVNNINGIYDEYYWRVGSGYHNAFSNIQKIKSMASNKKYLDSGDNKPLYNYNADEVNLDNGIKINGLKIKYSDMHNVSYKYDEKDKVFYRSMRGIVDKDRETGKQYYAKNIVVMYMKNYNLPDTETKGRQEVEDIGTGTGYYITNGKYINITWKKESAKAKTLWLDSDGKEITLNDGITYVQIVPITYQVDFELSESTDNIN